MKNSEPKTSKKNPKKKKPTLFTLLTGKNLEQRETIPLKLACLKEGEREREAEREKEKQMCKHNTAWQFVIKRQ